MVKSFGLSVALTALAMSSTAVQAFSSYANEWIRINYTAEGNWNESTVPAQKTIVAAAEWWAEQGPWTVTSKGDHGILPPTNNTHDYLSWRPYFWPDCSNVGNTTALTDQQVWQLCNYVRRDGEFNPDARLVNDTGIFQAMSDAVFYNALAWKISGDRKYSANVANFVNTWFINPDTYMTPNLDYAQTLRGPQNGEAKGSHTGVLDLKGMAKVASGIILLRTTGAEDWTPELDTAMNAWCGQYVDWLKTNSLALEEKAALNNHGSFYFTQLAAIQVLIGDYAGARGTINEFFAGIYMDQIDDKGEQPLEADRTRPYHYRAYNAAAIITTSRIAEYIGMDTWATKTKAGTDVQDAVDYAMTFEAGEEDPTELYPQVAAVASHFGDSDGKYAAYLLSKDGQYPGEAWFFYNQPLSDSGVTVTTVGGSSSSTTDDQTDDDSKGNGNGALKSDASIALGMTGLFVVLGYLFSAL